MKRQIRRGVFETNSSSMHSLAVMKRNDKYSPEEIKSDLWICSGEWHIYENDLRFGRCPFRILYSFGDKWCYACASLVHTYKDDKYNELENIALKYIPNLKKIKLPNDTDSFADKDDERFKDDAHYQKHSKTENELIDYLEQKGKEWGMRLGYWKSSAGYWCFDVPYTGSVDENILSGFLESEGITLEEFLINKKYIVIQDGDEYCEWEKAKSTGIINIDAIDHEYHTSWYTYYTQEVEQL
jgi:hypothetical protein